MIEIVKELGKEADGFASHFEVVDILQEYQQYVRTCWRGKYVHLEYDWKLYKLDKITEISQSMIDDAQKLIQIDQVIKKPAPSINTNFKSDYQ